MKTQVLIATVATGMLAAPANAADWYVSGSLGFSNPSSTVFNDGTNGGGNPKVDIDNTTKMTAAVGLAFTPNFRTELEFSQANYKTDESLQSGSGARAPDTFATDANFKVRALMVNAIYDFQTDTGFSPYIRAGVGKSFYDMDGGLFVSSSGGNTFGGFLPATFGYEGSGSDFAFQIGLGTSFALLDNADLTVEYRYSDLGSVATGYDVNGDRLQTDLKSHELLLGVRYTFN